MEQIAKDRYSLLRKIFPVSPGPQTASFFSERRMGEAFLEKEENPVWGMICHGEDMIIRGSCVTDDLLELVNNYSFSGLLEIESKFTGLVSECFPQAEEWGRVSYVSKNPPNTIPPDDIIVRMLNKNDAEQLFSIGENWIWKYYGNPQSLIEQMPVAGCFTDSELLSVSSVFTESSEYSDIAAATKDIHRGKNYGTFCTAFLSEFIIEKLRQRVVWNTSPDNQASVRIAEKLGFEKYELQTKLYKITRLSS